MKYKVREIFILFFYSQFMMELKYIFSFNYKYENYNLVNTHIWNSEKFSIFFRLSTYIF